MAEIEMRAWQDCRLEVREEDGVSRIVGRAIPFGELSVDLGGWREIIVAGAFDIAGDIRSLWQHDSSQVLGRTAAGTMRLTEDERGIYPDITPPDTQWARDALVSLKRGDVSGFSFGFYVEEDNWLVTGREVVRQVLRGQLLEVTPVTFPAYPTTSAQVRDQVTALLRAQQDGQQMISSSRSGAGAPRGRTITTFETARRYLMTIRELREKRANLWTQAKALHEKALAEKRDMTAEELQQWDGYNTEMDTLKLDHRPPRAAR